MIKALVKALLGTIASGIATLLLAVVAWAMTPGDGSGRDPQRLVHAAAAALDLSAEQESAVHVLLAPMLEDARNNAERLDDSGDECNANATPDKSGFTW